jgi:Flp pilus assembly pilin Flp
MKTGEGFSGRKCGTVLELIDDEHGATAVEYAILASLIAAGVVGSVQLLGGKTQALFQSAVNLWP